MKKLSLVLAMSLWLIQLSNAQVKRQYQDEKFSETTVVVKKDGASDQEILSANFDMDYVSMGTVIRITTEADKPVQSIPEQPTPEIIKLADESIPETPIQVQEQIEEAPAVAAAGNAEVPQEIVPAAARTTSSATSFSGSRKGGNYPVYSGYQGMGNKKRFKKSKRKKKNKKKCFKF